MTNINLNVFINSIPSVSFGGIANTALTGCARLTGLLASATAVMTAGELALRGCQTALSYTSWKTPEFITNSAHVNDFIGRIRPFKDKTTVSLLVQLAAFAAFGQLAHEAVRLSSGAAPAIYNVVLSVIGPFQLNPGVTFLGSLFGL